MKPKKVLTWLLFTRLISIFSFIFISVQAHAVEVYFEPDHRLPIVYITIAIKSGSVNDPASQSGLTRFVGQMLTRGSKSRSKEKIDIELDRLGARLSNYTRAEMQVLEGAVVSRNLDPFLKLLTEIISQPEFPIQEIEKLKKETLTEIAETLENDEEIARQRFETLLFPGHPYGLPILGTQKSIAEFSQVQLMEHYKKIYTLDNLLVIGTGDASAGTVEAWGKSFTDLRSSIADKSLLKTPQPLEQKRVVILDKPDRTQTQIYIGQIGPTMLDPDFFPLYLGNQAIGGTRQSRLMEQIRNQRGWSYGAYSFFRHGTKPRYWTFYLFPQNKYAPNALQLTLDILTNIQKNGITQAEFDFSKESLINNAGFNYDTPQKRLTNVLLEKTLGLPDGFMKSFGENLKKVTLKEVNNALKKALHPDKLLVTVLGTASVLKQPLADQAGISQSSIEVIDYKKEN